MKPLLVCSGEPAGIGPDLCLALANYALPIVVIGDQTMLAARAKRLGLDIQFENYQWAAEVCTEPKHLSIWPVPCVNPVIPGHLDPNNAEYVLEMLRLGTSACLKGDFSALITAPVQKSVINDAGIAFTGQTEFLAELCEVEQVVMMLASDKLRVALATTHLPLKQVAEQITAAHLISIIQTLYLALQRDFGLQHPKIAVAGLNPHAGEAGYLGREELDIIIPAMKTLASEGLISQGPFAADTLFTRERLQSFDAILSMYHDQGLPVLKYASFGEAVNISLGLPIIRCSVDHGTALDLAGTGKAKLGSLLAAIAMASEMAKHRQHYDAQD